MILIGVINQEQAIDGEDFNTLALLIGMMMLVAIARRSGMFQYLAIWSAKVARGQPWALLALLSLVTAVVSALLDNVTTVLLIAPVTLVITEQLKVPPYPFLFTEILASNIGGTATLIGDPPNIIIGSAAGLSFNDFVVNLGAGHRRHPDRRRCSSTISSGAGRCGSTRPRARASWPSMPREAITDWPLLCKSLLVIGLVIVGFVLARASSAWRPARSRSPARRCCCCWTMLAARPRRSRPTACNDDLRAKSSGSPSSSSSACSSSSPASSMPACCDWFADEVLGAHRRRPDRRPPSPSCGPRRSCRRSSTTSPSSPR